MTTSGVTIYELTRNQIIAAAMRKLGALALGQTPSSEDYTNGQIALNSWIANLQGLGMPVWKITAITITPIADQAAYVIGDGQAVDVPYLVRLNHAFLRDTTNGQNVPIDVIGLEQFNKLNNESTGRPVQCYYLPKVNLGTLTVWPAPDATTAADFEIHLIGQTPFEGFTGASETADFPQEWQNPLVYGLAVSLAPEYGVPINDRKLLMEQLNMYLDLATRSPSQDESVFFQVNTWS